MNDRYVVSKDPAVEVIASSPMDERPERVFLEVDQETLISVPAEVFDRAAVAWVKARKLQGKVGGPVGSEYGSPDCDGD